MYDILSFTYSVFERVKFKEGSQRDVESNNSVSLRSRSVSLRSRSVSLRSRSVSLRSRSVSLRSRSVSLRSRYDTLFYLIRKFPRWEGGHMLLAERAVEWGEWPLAYNCCLAGEALGGSETKGGRLGCAHGRSKELVRLTIKGSALIQLGYTKGGLRILRAIEEDKSLATYPRSPASSKSFAWTRALLHEGIVLGLIREGKREEALQFLSSIPQQQVTKALTLLTQSVNVSASEASKFIAEKDVSP
jgi:hypothetical protein